MKSRGPRKQVRATLQWERPAPAATAVTAVAARAGRPCASGQDARATSCPPTAPFSHFWFLWTHTPQARVCGALECGSLLPLSHSLVPRARRGIGALANSAERALREESGSRLPHSKASQARGEGSGFPAVGPLARADNFGRGGRLCTVGDREGKGSPPRLLPLCGDAGADVDASTLGLATGGEILRPVLAGQRFFTGTSDNVLAPGF